jgi:hypothetical protein
MDSDAEEEQPRLPLARVAMNLVWVLFLVVAMFARECGEG